jgi:hypothetical protein
LAVFFLGAMTLLRLGLFVLLGDDRGSFSQSRAGTGSAGGSTRVDRGRYAPLVALGTIPLLDPFRSTFGRRFWLTLLGLFSGGLIIFYVCDFEHHRYLGQRLNASVLGFLADATISSRLVWESYPVMWMALGIAVALSGAVAVVRVLHRRASAAANIPTLGANCLVRRDCGRVCRGDFRTGRPVPAPLERRVQPAQRSECATGPESRGVVHQLAALSNGGFRAGKSP